MGYKEKYEQALERARVWKEKSGMPKNKQGILDDIFPELRESEDEKIKKTLIDYFITYKKQEECGIKTFFGIPTDNVIAWLEKQGNKVIDCPQNYQDSSRPNGCIVLEDFYGGEGFYKLNLDYLNEKQVEEVEEMVRTWNKESKTSNENIKNCIGMCLTDTDEQRFKDFNTNLKDCLYWLEKSKAELKKNKTCKENDDSLTCEDEKIRKEIIAVFKGQTRFTSEEDNKKYIDWLERQGEKLPVGFYYVNSEGKKFYSDTFKYGNVTLHVEKQGEQEEPQVYETKDGEVVTYSETDGYKFVESTFHEGDWIIHNTANFVFKVINVDSNGYEVVNRENYKKTISFDNEYNYHFWAIKDAKDGDVLVNGSNIFIFHFFSDTRLMGYCHVNTDNGRFYDDLGRNECFCLIDAVVYPATKEQHDLLFQKMKEAGYEWDAEKKGLKKIEKQAEQKPTYTVKPKFKVGDIIKHNKANIICKVLSANVGFFGVYRLMNILGGDEMELSNVEQNFHLWSIEDAKDGDILKEDSCIFILEKMKPNETAIVHCCLFDDGDFDLGSTLSFDVDSTYPATKEQRDILFQKIHKAGYEWDAEKKELKLLIINGGDFDVQWSEEDILHLNKCISYMSKLDSTETEWLKSLKLKGK